LKESVHGEEDGLNVKQIAVKMKEIDERNQAADRARATINRPINRAANLAAKKYFCEICNVNCSDSAELKRHELSEKHINAAAGIAQVLTASGSRDKVYRENNKATKIYHCNPCNKTLDVNLKLQRHNRSNMHKGCCGQGQGGQVELYARLNYTTDLSWNIFIDYHGPRIFWTIFRTFINGFSGTEMDS
jgi:transcription elongation factor Elf1